MNIYWSYIDDNDVLVDVEYKTRLEAVHCAEDDFAERNRYLAHGEIAEAECHIISYNLTDDGEMVILSKEKYPLFEQGYHGDYVEHNTHWGLK